MRARSTRWNVFLASASVAMAIVVADTGHATTFVSLDQDQLADISDAAVIGMVVGIVSGRDIESGEIRTDIEIAVDEVLFGDVTQAQIVVREPGGRVGGDEEWNYGSPSFHRGEEVLVFLTESRDGTYRVTAMAMGKFAVQMATAGTTELVRDLGEGVQVLDGSGALTADPQAEVMPLSDAIRQQRRDRSDSRRDGEAAAEPNELVEVEQHGEFTFLGNLPARWFEPDWGEPVVFQVDPAGDPGPQLGPAKSVAAIYDAFDSWSAVSESSLALIEGAPLLEPVAFAGCSGENRIVFNDPFDEIADPVNCGGVLAVGGYCSTADTKEINGVEFRRIRVGKVTFNNGWSSCFEWNRCNLAEIATHEIGHAIGLGHSPEANAIMRSYAYFNGRCASLGSDDEDAVRFTYPANIVGPTQVPTVRPTRTPRIESTPTRTPTVRPTRTPGLGSTPTRTITATPTRTPTQVATWTPTWTPTQTMVKTPDSSTPESGHNRVRGNVRYYMCNSAVPGAEIELHGETSRMAKTGSNGDFDFGNVSEDHVDVRGTKQGSINGAISALDVAYVLQAVAGERDLTPLQKIACDATGDGSVSPVDASRIMQFTLGAIPRLPVADRCGSPWWVVPASSSATMAVAPVLTPVQCSPGGYDVPSADQDVPHLAFNAVLFGDCNGGWASMAGALTAADKKLDRNRVRVGRVRTSGNTATVPVYVRSTRPYQALDIDLRFEESVMSPTGIEGRRISSRALLGHRVVEPGVLRVAFASPDLVKRRQGVLLFVKFELTQPASTAGAVHPIAARIDDRFVRGHAASARR